MTQLPTQSPSLAGYFRLIVSNVAREEEDEFSHFCFEHGAQGVSEELRFEQGNLCYEPDVVETKSFDVNIYFAERPSEGTLLQLQSQFPNVHLHLIVEENRDWMEEWKKDFKPFLFAKPFWVVPSWCEIPAEAQIGSSQVLLIDPGMAFGTGTHETTRLAARLLIDTITAANETTSNRPEAQPKSLIDVGTGTAVLALVASRLGFANVIGLDNDPEARRTARENLLLNQATNCGIQIPDHDLSSDQGTYDVVVANIIDGVLTQLAPDLARVLRPGGVMILSGVLAMREEAFYQDFADRTGLELEQKLTDGEWSAARLKKAQV